MTDDTKPRLYFAHPVTDYGSDIERSAVAVLSKAFDVLNPNTPEHAFEYSEFGMDYFMQVARTCHTCAFMRLPCGSISAGVAKEIGGFLVRGAPVFEVLRDGTFTRPLALTVEETRAEISRIRGAPAARPPRPEPKNGCCGHPGIWDCLDCPDPDTVAWNNQEIRAMTEAMTAASDARGREL